MVCGASWAIYTDDRAEKAARYGGKFGGKSQKAAGRLA